MSLELSVHPLTSYESRPITWLWEDRVPLGKVTLIAGDPGLGKSFVSLDIAARLSTARAMPGSRDERDGIDGMEGSALLFSAEDDPGDTLRPRLEAMGANLNRIHIAPSVMFTNDAVKPMEREARPFQLDKHVGVLEKQLAEHDSIRLVVIDPISAYMGEADSHNNAQVRAVLGRLAQVARHRGVAVVCVTHLNKGGGQQSRAVYRTMGSLAFTAAARIVHLVGKDPNDASRRLMIPVKANITGDVGGVAYTIGRETTDTGAETGRVKILWEPGEVRVNADDLECEDAGERVGQLDEAVAWLEERLKDGPVGAKVLLDLCEREGLTVATVRRAKSKLGVRSARMGEAWCWKIEA